MTNVEKLFYKFDELTENYAKEKNISYLQALAKILELKNDKDYFFVLDNFSKEEIKKAYLFLTLKAYKKLDNTNYAPTPQIISIYISAIIKAIYKNKKISAIDLASGRGTFFLDLIENYEGQTDLTSVEIDSDFLKLQADIFNLLEKEISLINTDALKNTTQEKYDLVITESPSGYYTDEENSLNFKLCSNENKTLNAPLFLEQTTKYLKKQGVGILVLPKEILNFNKQIKNYIENFMKLNAVIMLPKKMFKCEKDQKIIMLVTKKESKTLPENILLTEIKEGREAFLGFIRNFKKWFEEK